jgi:SAM-dependent methyltransferase
MSQGEKTPEAYDLRAEAYQRSRPSYPPEVFHTLGREIDFSPSHRIADIGSGPGTFTQSLIEYGNEVFAVEPGEGMRYVAERLLGNSPRFHSIAGTAEYTTLPDSCVDHIAAAQALTWFDPEPARRELCRIVKPGGYLIGLWYNPTGDSAYMKEFGALHGGWSSRYAGSIQPRYPRSEILDTIIPERSEVIFSCQLLETWEQCVDAYVSAAGLPLPSTPEGARNIEDMRGVFDRHQQNNSVPFQYEVTLCWGVLRPV